MRRTSEVWSITVCELCFAHSVTLVHNNRVSQAAQPCPATISHDISARVSTKRASASSPSERSASRAGKLLKRPSNAPAHTGKRSRSMVFWAQRSKAGSGAVAFDSSGLSNDTRRMSAQCCYARVVHETRYTSAHTRSRTMHFQRALQRNEISYS
jgi:hypothetical protein